MAEELEIKLTVEPSSEAAVREWIRKALRGQEPEIKHLANRYFDTPESSLNREKAALRIRDAGDQWIQTLKTKGDFVDGAHRRQEWEWVVDKPVLDLALLKQTPLSSSVDLSRLTTVFETNFQRFAGLLRSDDELVECVLDSGVVAADGRERALHEVEFEHKGGSGGNLLALAERLAEEVPLFLNLVSKAEQGYHLAGLYTPAPMKSSGTVSSFLHGLSLAWLTGQPDTALASAAHELTPLARELNCDGAMKALLEELGRKGEPFDPFRVTGLGRLQLALIRKDVS